MAPGTASRADLLFTAPTDVLTATPGRYPGVSGDCQLTPRRRIARGIDIDRSPTFTWSRNSVKVAFRICAAVNAPDSCVRSNCTGPMLAHGNGGRPEVTAIALDSRLLALDIGREFRGIRKGPGPRCLEREITQPSDCRGSRTEGAASASRIRGRASGTIC